MLRTRVGYAGGKKDKPTYRSIGDHTEAIQIEFDTKVLSFEKLLKVFWSSHDPCGGTWSTQYKSVLWTHGEAQAKTARAFVDAWQKQHKREATTQILAAPRFWIAEDYHQKYRLRGNKTLLHALFGKKPTEEQVRESTLTARVNGWISGHGTTAEIEAGVKALALSAKARDVLYKALGRRAPALAK